MVKTQIVPALEKQMKMGDQFSFPTSLLLFHGKGMERSPNSDPQVGKMDITVLPKIACLFFYQMKFRN